MLADPGEARGCSTNTSVSDSLTDPLLEIPLQRRHALTVADWDFSHKTDYVTIFQEILNFKRHPNRITGPKVTAILLNGWILPIDGASAVKGLRLQPAQEVCFL